MLLLIVPSATAVPLQRAYGTLAEYTVPLQSPCHCNCCVTATSATAKSCHCKLCHCKTVCSFARPCHCPPLHTRERPYGTRAEYTICKTVPLQFTPLQNRVTASAVPLRNRATASPCHCNCRATAMVVPLQLLCHCSHLCATKATTTATMPLQPNTVSLRPCQCNRNCCATAKPCMLPCTHCAAAIWDACGVYDM